MESVVEEGKGSSVAESAAREAARPDSPHSAGLSDPSAWLRSGEYLPGFMRDFHDQKELFKALQEVVERRNKKHGASSYTAGLNWIAAHVYTVDVFLWVLAKHGYTLQRSRRPLAFGDIGDFVSEATKRERAAATQALREALESAGQ